MWLNYLRKSRSDNKVPSDVNSSHGEENSDEEDEENAGQIDNSNEQGQDYSNLCLVCSIAIIYKVKISPNMKVAVS